MQEASKLAYEKKKDTYKKILCKWSKKLEASKKIYMTNLARKHANDPERFKMASKDSYNPE